MTRVVDGLIYNTEKAELLFFIGINLLLYKTEKNNYFFEHSYYSPYIEPISPQDLQIWASKNCSVDVYRKIFPEQKLEEA